MINPSVFSWRTGEPSVFADDKKFNGRNSGIAERSQALREAKDQVPHTSIATPQPVKQKPASGKFSTV